MLFRHTMANLQRLIRLLRSPPSFRKGRDPFFLPVPQLQFPYSSDCNAPLFCQMSLFHQLLIFCAICGTSRSCSDSVRALSAYTGAVTHELHVIPCWQKTTPRSTVTLSSRLPWNLQDMSVSVNRISQEPRHAATYSHTSKPSSPQRIPSHIHKKKVAVSRFFTGTV